MSAPARKARFGTLSRRVRRLVAIAALLGAIFVVADLAVGCYYAGEIKREGLRVNLEPPELDLSIETAGDGRITLRHTGDAAAAEHPSTWGIETETGYGRVGGIVSSSGDVVTREFQTLEGTVTAGQRARLDKHAFPGDPVRAHRLPFRNVTYESPLGPMPAWYVRGSSDMWVIFVHGVNGKRTEGLRILRPLSDSDAQVLLISYRNDEGAPGDPSGQHQYGRTEWQDLEAAAYFALDNGAKGLVIAGTSMGGSVAMSFMRNSVLAAEVDALILDSPMLDFSATVDDAGRRRNLPGFLTATAKWVAGWQYGVAWDELDYLKDAGRLDTPVLLFHGTADERVPLATSEALTAMRGDTVRFEVFEDAQHAGSWNLDPARYELAVRSFLAAVAARKQPGRPAARGAVAGDSSSRPPVTHGWQARLLPARPCLQPVFDDDGVVFEGESRELVQGERADFERLVAGRQRAACDLGVVHAEDDQVAGA